MTTPVPTVTVVLCVRNGAATLGRQLGALDGQVLDEPWEVVVVDNGSSDGTRALAEGWARRHPRARVIEEPERGANRARNRGVSSARAARIVYCDADDEVSPGWLRAMVSALDTYDIVGGALDPGPLNGPYAPREGCLQQSELPTAFGIAWTVGANFGFRRSVYEALGGFDERFVLGSDEVDFCVRAHVAGFTIGFAPGAVVRYQLKETAPAVLRQRVAYGRGHERLVAKHSALGTIRSRPLQRWKSVVVGVGRLVRTMPALVHPEQRLQYLASVGFLAGRVMELLHA